ncbi:glucose/arabinose dehydrogenase [Dyadobacter jejuensis]|uniref:Glucose/arabinose dehydrogenase n=1 Tax=Dyadobacter jejuensis TaxID=1082580 RepID=A0A316ABA4_9BACT|nr:PQQ-dependent sugar dehydrogenase [Dyadobacter jejuensis]PWJ54993.1 glucose/arabinose dehydrogenase [Dyadobacter jejuensis]
MQKLYSKPLLALLVMGGISGLSAYKSVPGPGKELPNEAKEIKLPAGFQAQELATGLGAARHLAVNKVGDIYVRLSKLKDGHGMYVLKDRNGDGVLEDKTLLGDYAGTGVAIHKGYLYTSSNSAVFRYKLNAQEELAPGTVAETLVTGLADHGRDNAKPLTLDHKGNLYVTVGSYNDNCRGEGQAMGMSPCTVLDSAGGIWKFRADKANQTFGDGKRYITGIKNAVGLDWNFKTKSLYATSHGRGRFDDKFPQYYTAKQSAELPAETLYKLKDGDDAGWPTIYYDQFQSKKMLAPEYGGDGKKTAGEQAIDPIAAFPAHLAPNDLLFYTGNMFPDRYKNGAFIAFHNQSPELKKGYFVAFVPFVNGKAGAWEIFADNFAGVNLESPEGPVQHRPCGLAQGPDGALYVCDDLNGSLFKITYSK